MGQKLLLTRHATARSGAARDIERPLSTDGRVQAGILAAKLKPLIQGAIVLHSPALRAAETAQIISEGAAADLISIDELYWGEEDEWLRLIPLTGQPTLVVGHAPSIPMAASMIAAGEGPDLIFQRGCPTATTYVFEVPDGLSKIGWHSCDLKDIIITPK
ncbi:MAG: phosphoglycerate mutase family protein [Actinomycetaceae bacterium]|nr:phosphoglycerate mutase family protein [Actinomycetaceae bacterium]